MFLKYKNNKCEFQAKNNVYSSLIATNLSVNAQIIPKGTQWFEEFISTPKHSLIASHLWYLSARFFNLISNEMEIFYVPISIYSIHNQMWDQSFNILVWGLILFEIGN